MTPISHFSSPTELPEDVQARLKTATRAQTSCGAGLLVWHIWGAETADPRLAPLVLFHGGSGSWTHWVRNIEALAGSGRRVYVPDLPGFGDSAAPAIGQDADALPELMSRGLSDLLGTQACDLVGFSFGGIVAGFLAAQFPAQVARLFLVGTPGLGISPEPAFQLKAWRHLSDSLQRDAVHRANLASLMLYRPEAITELALRLHIANVVRDRMKGRRLARTNALARCLPALQCPLQAIYGREDVLFRGQLAALERTLQTADDFRGLTCLEAAGHWVQFEQADAFNAALLAALQA